MVEYKWTRLLNKCMYAVTKYFFTFPISKELYVFKKKTWWTQLLKLHQVLFIYKKLAANDDGLGWSRSKISLFRKKELIFCSNKHFLQRIMMPCYSCHFWIFHIFNFFPKSLVSLFLAFYDQFSVRFNDSNVFEFTNFPFKTKYNTVSLLC